MTSGSCKKTASNLSGHATHDLPDTDGMKAKSALQQLQDFLTASAQAPVCLMLTF